MTDQINTGGAAFPQFEVVSGERDGHGDAIEAYTITTGGMTLRDYFAAKAMQGLMTACDNDGTWMATGISDEVAKNAYEVADAMLAARGGL